MIGSRPYQMVVFVGHSPSMGTVAENALRKGCECCFLCVLKPEESSERVKSTWMFAVQPLDPALCLFIIHEPRHRTFDGVADFAQLWSRSRRASCPDWGGEMDVLFLSDEASWRGSRRLAKELAALQLKLQKSALNCLVRRV